MNIFVVDTDPVKAAASLCNKHIVKMPLETAQLLCTAVYVLSGIKTPYKPCYINHPCGVWTRQSEANFDWLVTHGLALCDAYTAEYGKEHKSAAVIRWAALNKPDCFQEQSLTAHPTCMPAEYIVDDVVTSYRNYYNGAKAAIAKWKKRTTPDWFQK